MKSSTSGAVTLVWMSLDRLTRSNRLLQTDRTSEDRLLDKLVSIFTYEISINFIRNFREKKQSFMLICSYMFWKKKKKIDS